MRTHMKEMSKKKRLLLDILLIAALLLLSLALYFAFSAGQESGACAG